MSTKNELFGYLQNLNGYKGLSSSPELESENATGDKVYKINFRYQEGWRLSFIDIYYVVINEGLPDEEAFILDREPKTIEEIVNAQP